MNADQPDERGLAADADTSEAADTAAPGATPAPDPTPSPKRGFRLPV